VEADWQYSQVGKKRSESAWGPTRIKGISENYFCHERPLQVGAASCLRENVRI